MHVRSSKSSSKPGRQHQITFMDGSGDTPIHWNPDDAASTAKAKAEFDRIIGKAKDGGLGRSMFLSEEEGGRQTEFNPEVKEYIATKPVYGG